MATDPSRVKSVLAGRPTYKLVITRTSTEDVEEREALSYDVNGNTLRMSLMGQVVEYLFDCKQVIVKRI